MTVVVPLEEAGSWRFDLPFARAKVPAPEKTAFLLVPVRRALTVKVLALLYRKSSEVVEVTRPQSIPWPILPVKAPDLRRRPVVSVNVSPNAVKVRLLPVAPTMRFNAFRLVVPLTLVSKLPLALALLVAEVVRLPAAVRLSV